MPDQQLIIICHINTHLRLVPTAGVGGSSARMLSGTARSYYMEGREGGRV
jgi:hypothetical protein